MRIFPFPAKIATPGLAWLILLFAVLALAPASAVAEYRLQSGDILEVSVIGIPDFRQRCPIGVEGKITLPLVGQITVGGLSLADARAAVAQALSHKLYRQLTSDGREVPHLILGDEVVVAVAEYRPIYVTDGVAKPGAYPYRPGMTVRDAIALAGGYGRDVEGIDARDQYDVLSIDSARLQIDIARLRAELAGKAEIDLKGLRADGVAPVVLSEFISMEAQQLKTDQDDYGNQKTYLSRLIKETQDQVSALLAEQAQQQSSLAEQQKDAVRIRGLFQKSLVQISRVEDEDRVVSGMIAELFKMKARISSARISLEGYTRALQKLADQRKIEIMRNLEKATSELAAVNIHLETASARVRYVGAEKHQNFQQGSGRDLVIFRNERGDQQSVAADEDTLLLPGDTVGIAGSGSRLNFVRSTGGRGVARNPAPPYRVASASGKGQLRDGAWPNAAARAPSLLPGVAPKLATPVAYGAPIRGRDGGAGPPAPARPQRSAPLNRGGVSTTMPSGAARAETAPPVVVPSAEDRSAGRRLREAGDMKIIMGDVAAARLFYERAAEAGDARAALNLGNSFNPSFLARLGVRGMRGNTVLAARWYRRAHVLGDSDAEKALRTLRR